MAEYKQYVVQNHENGSVMISEDVIAAIVEHATTEVEGVIGLNMKPGADIADLIGKKTWGRGMKIAIDAENAVSIDCNVTVAYGQSVVAVAKSLQEAISSAVTSMTGVTISCINVNVCGIQRQ